MYVCFILEYPRHRFDWIPFLCVIITYALMKTYTSPMTSTAYTDAINGSMTRPLHALMDYAALKQPPIISETG